MISTEITSKPNRRVKYTKMVLRQSLLDVMACRPISKITVTELCARSDINRATFYNYYSDPYDLLAQIEQELFEQVQHFWDVSERSENSIIIANRQIFKTMAMAENRDLCRVLFSEFGDKEFLKKILDLGHDHTIKIWKAEAKNIPPTQLEVLYTFLSNGSLGVIQNWLHNGLRETPEEIAQLIEDLSYRGLQAFFKVA